MCFVPHMYDVHWLHTYITCLKYIPTYNWINTSAASLIYTIKSQYNLWTDKLYSL
jgi:Zn-dependent M32 family carboxypeptidase